MANSLGELWKKGTTPPLSSDLPEGGLAIDVLNEKAYSKNNTGGIFEIGGGAPENHTHEISEIDGLQNELNGKESSLGSPDIDGKLLSSTAGGVRTWISPPQGVTVHNLLTGRDEIDSHPIEAVTNLQSELDGKASAADLTMHIDDVANPHSVTKSQVGLGSVSNISPADMPINDATQVELDLKSNLDQIYKRSAFINESTGVADAGKPIVLNDSGNVDVSMIEISVFQNQGNFTPEAALEYPPEPNDPGWFWVIEGVGTIGTGGYTFTDGWLQGQTIYDNEMLVRARDEEGTGNPRWSIVHMNIDPGVYYMLDGTNPIIAPFSGGGQQFKNAAEGTDQNDLITLGQVAPLLDSYVKIAGDTMSGDLSIDKNNPSLTLIGDGNIQSRIIDTGSELQLQTNRTNIVFGGVNNTNLSGYPMVRKGDVNVRLISANEMNIGTY